MKVIVVDAKPLLVLPWTHLGTLAAKRSEPLPAQHDTIGWGTNRLSLQNVNVNGNITTPDLASASSCSRSEASLALLSDADGNELSISTEPTEYTRNDESPTEPRSASDAPGSTTALVRSSDSDLLGLTLASHDGGQWAVEVDDSDLICDSNPNNGGERITGIICAGVTTNPEPTVFGTRNPTSWMCHSTTGSPRITVRSRGPPSRLGEDRDSDALSDAGLTSVRVGLGNEIHRWEKGSALTWSIDNQSFLGHADAVLVEESARKAMTTWRDLGLDTITFRQVPFTEPSTSIFTFRYGGVESNGDLAVAFFPQDYPRKKNVFVYDSLLAQEHRAYVVNVLAHEIGHLLGLRHEFQTPMEIQHPSLLIGENNPASVMNYFPDLSLMVVGSRDIEETKLLYSLPRNSSYKGWTVKVSPKLKLLTFMCPIEDLLPSFAPIGRIPLEPINLTQQLQS
ncbi:hypothetical protein B0H67DRAFT_606834 [Lasiosphaeris hirsuta]|uniref:Peptidase metallopeptidase domain-containing protein n=1 Tax=Lasiosphaeris hirsuta TaxID=260670 RepID=A0AA40AY92_9PEZI|nr:hypothetical protein B0H67DRAFT_606834 [Lasiosphaeris hirsuta]